VYPELAAGSEVAMFLERRSSRIPMITFFRTASIRLKMNQRAPRVMIAVAAKLIGRERRIRQLEEDVHAVRDDMGVGARILVAEDDYGGQWTA